MARIVRGGLIQASNPVTGEASVKKIKDAMQAYTDITRQYTDYPRYIDRAKLGLAKAYEQQHDRKRARAIYQEVASSSQDPALKKQAEDRLRKGRR